MALKIAIGLEYDGSAFHGWQTQPDGSGIQDDLERALSQIAGTRIETACAGRTDAGVHALGQVVHFETDIARPMSAWTRGVGALLSTGVAVKWAREVEVEFHARFSATGRRYVYWLLNRSQRPGLLHGRVGWFHGHLDEQLMREAAQCLLGTHDFSAFRASECQAKTPVRTVRELAISRRGDLVRFELAADAFLHHMVRNIVGTLVYIGCGRQPSAWTGELLESRDRTRAAPTFSPSGLYLAEVEYDERWQLPRTTDLQSVEDVLAVAG
jgi:tRNA pseudouridine38-40 synthase